MNYEGDNMSGVRKSNRAAVLCCLHENGGLSRKKLAETLGLTQAAMTKIVSELLSEGLLTEGDSVPSPGAGRREVTLTLEARSRCALGVFLGLGGAVLSGVRLDGSVAFSETVPLPQCAPAEETVKALAERLTALAEADGLPREQIIGLGVAVRGTIGADGRSVKSSFNALDTEDFPICERFEQYTGLRCVLSNNVRALLAAQLFLDRESGHGSCVFLRCERGIGAAASLGGSIWEGERRQCAEIGHIPVVRRGGKPCHCGKTGCLETIASPSALREDALSLLSPERTPLLWRCAREKGTEAVTVGDVLEAARGGDAGAAAVVDRGIEALADALKSAVYLLDPGRVILYGSVFEHPYYLSRLRAEMALGVDGQHTLPVEKSSRNGLLENAAAGILAAERFLKNGGSAL